MVKSIVDFDALKAYFWITFEYIPFQGSIKVQTDVT